MSKRIFRSSDVVPNPRRDVDDEIAFHLEMRAREYRARGMSPDEARRAASAAFGDVGAVIAETRSEREAYLSEAKRRERMRGLALDVTFGARTLRKEWPFTIAAVLTLALGIGAAAAMFAIVNGVLLRPLPYLEPQRLAMVWMTGQGTNGPANTWPLSSGFFSDLETETKSFARVAALRSWSYAYGDGEESEQLPGARVTPAVFDVLGVRPALGHAFTESEALAAGGRVAMISDALWERRFGRDPGVVGRAVSLNGESFTVSGVMPPGFSFPRGAELPAALSFSARTEVWTPLLFSAAERENYGTQNLSVVGRLAAGVSIDQSQVELSALLTRLLERLGASHLKIGFRPVLLGDHAAAPVQRGLWILLGAVGLLLAIACANVASLLVARTGRRERELAVRVALGAGRRRLLGQLVIENLMLSILGAAVGALLARWMVQLMLSMVPGSLPRADDVTVDWRVLVASVAVTGLVGVLFGVSAALQAFRAAPATTLQGSSVRSTVGRSGVRGRRLVVMGEVAMSVVLLIGAGLLVRSFIELERVEPGFNPSSVLTGEVSFPLPGEFNPARDGATWASNFSQLNERLRNLPGVTSVGGVSSLPLTGRTESGGFRIEGRPAGDPTTRMQGEYAIVTGDYFQAMGIRLVSGRVLDARDGRDAPPVAVVSRELARRYFPDGQVVGQRITALFDFRPTVREIVGVVDDVRQTSLEAAPSPAIYVPQGQMTYPGLTMVLRTAGDPLAVLPMVKRELRQLSPGYAFAQPRTLDDVFAASLARQRFSMTLLSLFAAIALVLAAVGLYGTISLAVSERTRELGVRVALGATPGALGSLILREGFAVVGAGIIVGLAAAAGATRVLSTMLHGVGASDPAVFASCAAIVMAVAVAATIIPARRAVRVDAMTAIRG